MGYFRASKKYRDVFCLHALLVLGRTTGGMFQDTSFFLNKNLITTEDLYEYYFRNVS